MVSSPLKESMAARFLCLQPWLAQAGSFWCSMEDGCTTVNFCCFPCRLTELGEVELRFAMAIAVEMPNSGDKLVIRANVSAIPSPAKALLKRIFYKVLLRRSG